MEAALSGCLTSAAKGSFETIKIPIAWDFRQLSLNILHDLSTPFTVVGNFVSKSK